MKKHKRLKRILCSLACLVVGLIAISPILFVIIGGLKNDADFTSIPPIWFPKLGRINWAYYREALRSIEFYYSRFSKPGLIPSLQKHIPLVPLIVLNSVITSTLCTIVQLVVCSLTAYAFALYEFKGKRLLFFMVLITAMLPKELLMIGNFNNIVRFHWIDTYLGIVAPDFVSAVGIFLLRQKFKIIHGELRDASTVDGCGNFKLFSKICVPEAMPMMIVLGFSTFISTWNSYLWPMLVTNQLGMRTVSVAVPMLTFKDSGSQAPLFASLAVMVLPLLLLLALFQRKLQAVIQEAQPWPDLYDAFDKQKLSK